MENRAVYRWGYHQTQIKLGESENNTVLEFAIAEMGLVWWYEWKDLALKREGFS